MEQHINACERTLSALGTYLDNELGIRKRQQVEAHLANCANCQAELAALRRLSDLLHDHDSKPLPRTIPADRFTAQVILQLKPQASPPAWKRVPPLLWWLIPAAVLGGWVFLHATFFVSGLAITLLESGALPTWIADGLMDVLTLPTPPLNPLLHFPPNISQTLNYLILQLQTLFLTLVPQLLLVLLYWSWLVGWQILKRGRRQGSPVIY
jgi:hypothetical protein